MPQRIPCEFSLLRYVPDVVKGEFVNIGVLLRQANSAEPPRVRFTRDWTRVRCMDTAADLALLEGLEQEIVRIVSSTASPTGSQTLLTALQDSLSNSFQITEPQASLAENLAAEMDLLMRLYVESMPVARSARSGRRATGRPAILAAMRTEFERVHVWPLLSKRVPAERYTRKGDPLRIDCGYRTEANGSPAAVRMFHAVSLDGDIETAKVLAFASARLREGVARLESAALELTAVVEPLRLVAPEENTASEAEDRYRFGVETLEQEAIRVVTLNDLARAAATAQHDLGL